jgi:16S rRNA (guanine527-N7)-methyltransferase
MMICVRVVLLLSLLLLMSGGAGMDSAADRRSALSLTPVSRETEARLAILVAELERWQSAKNLISGATLSHIWSRHVADSLQLLNHVPGNAQHWLDLGSGGGFPGLPLAAVFAGQSGRSMTLVESNGRKCAFLRHAARVMIGEVPKINTVDVVTARALAPLSQLLTWTEKLLTSGTIGLFPKGQDVDQELTEAAKYWKFDVTIHQSLTDSAGRILRVSSLTRRYAD